MGAPIGDGGQKGTRLPNSGNRTAWQTARRHWQDIVDAGKVAGATDFAALAEAQRALGDRESAEATVREGLSRWPHDGDLLQQKAELATGRKDWRDAAEIWKIYLGKFRSSAHPSAFAKCARALCETGDPQAAETIIATGLTLYPRDRKILRQGAHVAERCSNMSLAARRWGDACNMETNANSVSIRLKQIKALRASGDTKTAEAVLSKILTKHPGNIALLKAQAGPADIADLKSGQRGGSGQKQVQEICEAFWAIEKRLSLLSWQMHGVDVWPLLRMQVYYAITRKVGLFDDPHPGIRSESDAANVAQALKRTETYWNDTLERHHARRPKGVGSFAFLPDFRQKKHAILMATKKLNGTEPYTDALREELGDQAILLDRALDGKAMPGAIDYAALQDVFRRKYADPKYKTIDQRSSIICDQITDHFQRELGITIDNLQRSCRAKVSDFLAVKSGFAKFFEINRIDTLFLTNAYGVTTRATLSAAKASGARVVELQHGFISPYHLGYSWPGSPEIPDSPDELWCFGAFWPDTTEFAADTKVRVIGAPYVHRLAREHAAPRDPKLVVFTSQGVIGRRLFDIAVTTARRRPDLKIVFRLHPNEKLETFEEMARQVENRPKNFSISHRTPNIFALLAAAEVQVGAFSTTLFEGMVLGTRTVVLDLPGIEYMRPVIARGDVLHVENVDDLPARIDMAPRARDPHYYYAVPTKRLQGMGVLKAR